MSGRIEARTGLRMMPTFPRSPLSFRTAGFPQYGWKAGLSGGAFPDRQRLKPAPGMRLLTAGLPSPFVHLRVGAVCPVLSRVADRTMHRHGGWVALRPRGPRSGPGYAVPVPPPSHPPPPPPPPHSAPLPGTSRLPRRAAYPRCLRWAGAPRRPARGSGLSLPFRPDMPSSLTPGSSTSHVSSVATPTRPSPRSERLGTPNNPAIRFTRDPVFEASLVRVCYGLSGCSPPWTDWTRFPQPPGAFTSRLPTGRSPFPPLDMTTTATGLLCWRDFHPQEWQLASLHQIRAGPIRALGSHLGCVTAKRAVRGPAPVTRLPGPEPGACGPDPRSPRPPPFAPPTPRTVARRCSPASPLLWRGLTSPVRASSATAPRLPDADQTARGPVVGREISRFPCPERACMPGSLTTPDRPGARAGALARVAFRFGNSVGIRNYETFAAQWLACRVPCRRFAPGLAARHARLGADVDRYSFVVSDSHRLLLAGLPAHYQVPLIRTDEPCGPVRANPGRWVPLIGTWY